MTNITVHSPADGQELGVPFTVSGTATASGAGVTNVVAIEIQIDNAAQNSLAVTAAPEIPFSFTISESDCPQVDTWYMLSIYCWDDQGNLDVKTISFKRVDIDDSEEEVPGP